MRIVHNPQLVFGQVPIEELPLDPRSRDDIPAVLKGIQHLFRHVPLRTKIFDLLERHLLHDASAAAEPAAPPSARPDPGRVRILAKRVSNPKEKGQRSGRKESLF